MSTDSGFSIVELKNMRSPRMDSLWFVFAFVTIVLAGLLQIGSFYGLFDRGTLLAPWFLPLFFVTLGVVICLGALTFHTARRRSA